jgi:hypothetical protein
MRAFIGPALKKKPGLLASRGHTLKPSKGGQFAIHVQALLGNPYDGHTLARVIPAIEWLVRPAKASVLPIDIDHLPASSAQRQYGGTVPGVPAEHRQATSGRSIMLAGQCRTAESAE